MKELQHLLSRVRAATEKYNMIDEGDLIAIGVSGGKDSLAMLCAMAEMRDFYPKHYDIVAIMIDMGFDDSDFVHATPIDHSSLIGLCERLNVKLVIKKTQIARIIFDERKETNPCSLCSRMRRGVLDNVAIENGCNKLALGHHSDDAVETAMMNLFFNGNFESFSPVTQMSKKEITVIRPMILTREKDIKTFARKASLPVEKTPCPEDENTERAKMKEYLYPFEKEHRGLYARILGALERGNISGWFE